MANYARSEVSIQYGATSALQDPDISKLFTAASITATEFEHRKLTALHTSSSTLSLSHFLTIQELYIYNADTTNYVECIYQSVPDSATATMDIPAGQWVKLVGIDPAVSLVLNADTASCVCDIIVIGT